MKIYTRNKTFLLFTVDLTNSGLNYFYFKVQDENAHWILHTWLPIFDTYSRVYLLYQRFAANIWVDLDYQTIESAGKNSTLIWNDNTRDPNVRSNTFEVIIYVNICFEKYSSKTFDPNHSTLIQLIQPVNIKTTNFGNL